MLRLRDGQSTVGEELLPAEADDGDRLDAPAREWLVIDAHPAAVVRGDVRAGTGGDGRGTVWA
jgi:hypothetical protein